MNASAYLQHHNGPRSTPGVVVFIPYADVGTLRAIYGALLEDEMDKGCPVAKRMNDTLTGLAKVHGVTLETLLP
jgi:hypothetical protein